MTVSAGRCAQAVLEVVPAVMRYVRAQMRSHRGAGLTVPQLVEVRFKGNRKAYFEWADSEPLREREAVIVESERGADFGIVSATDGLAQRKCDPCRGCDAGGEDGPPARAAEPEPTRRVLRRAGDADRQQHAELRVQEDDVRRRVRDKVRQHDLPMIFQLKCAHMGDLLGHA